MYEFVVSWAESTWQVLVDSALFFLIGLVLAGLVWVFLNEKNLNRLVGRSRTQAVFRAALIGVPLPLCSCSVLPVARQLRGSGLGKGGTVSFMISTPESSVDSILLTYSLTDPILTVARPVAAFLTAASAGLLENRYDQSESVTTPETDTIDACCDCDCETPSVESGTTDTSLPHRIGHGLKHSFTTIIGDLAFYLLMGYILAGLAAAIFGSPLNLTGEGRWWPYLAALVIGVPLYICATSSTPLAAVLLGAGFPPGAILVFLMVGPATNLATLTVTHRILGLASTGRYLLSIVVVSLLCGLLLDQVYIWSGTEPAYSPITGEGGVAWVHTVSALILAGLILYHSGRDLLRRLSRTA